MLAMQRGRRRRASMQSTKRQQSLTLTNGRTSVGEGEERPLGIFLWGSRMKRRPHLMRRSPIVRPRVNARKQANLSQNLKKNLQKGSGDQREVGGQRGPS